MSEWRRIYIRPGNSLGKPSHIGYIHQGGQPTSPKRLLEILMAEHVLVDLPNVKITKNGDQINLIWRVP